MIYPTEKEPYIEHPQHRVEHCIPGHGQIHRPLEFTFDPGEFIRDPPKVVARVLDQILDG